MRSGWRLGAAVLSVAAAALYLNNTDAWTPAPGRAPTLLAHRGVFQQFDRRGLLNDTCTAARMLPPSHGLLENTLPSMRAAFAAGADTVEIDVHPTTDGHFAVFHDWTVDCRTEGRGVTRQHSLAQLKQLDVGFGYTADGGKTFPFRGQGVGMMPSLDEVFAAFPQRRFLLNVKSNDAKEGVLLAQRLARLPVGQRQLLSVYGGHAPIAEIRQRVSDVRTMSRASLKSCLLQYLALGWSGWVPEACTRSVVLVPINAAPWMWGWPGRFLARMEAAGSQVFVLGPYEAGEFSTGIDSLEELARLPPDYAGGIWTNRIEVIAPAVRR